MQTIAGVIADIADELARSELATAPAATGGIMRRLAEHFDVDVAFLRLHDLRHRTSTLYAEWPPRSTGTSIDPLGVLHFDNAGPIISSQEHQKHIVELHEELAQPSHHRLLDAAGMTTPRALLIAPVLSAKGATIGVIGFDSSTPRQWSDDERSALTTVASLLALTHARLVAELRLSRWADRDQLTRLPNRTALLAHLADRLSTEKTSPVTALLVRFTDVGETTDRLGHDAGDQFVVSAAERFRVALLGSAVVFRTAAHEFVVVPPSGNTSDARRMAAGLRSVLEAPLQLAGEVVVPRVNVGIASTFPESPDPDALLRGLRQAVTHARTEQGTAVSVLNRTIVRTAKRRNEIEAGIRSAVHDGSMRLDFQPEVDLRTRCIVGAEALVRWQHPALGELPPEAFLDVVESMDLSSDLGRWVLRTACAEFGAWRRDGIADDLVLRINVSPRQLVDPQFLATVTDALQTNGLADGTLCLEFTETVVMDDLKAAGTLVERLRSLGVKVAIDDFGTGYSGFARLRALPVDAVKIDRSFVRDVDMNLHDRAIVAAVTALAAAFEIDVVAEGVETEGAADTLLELGCTYAQGFLFSPPVDGARFRGLLEEQRLRSERVAQ